MKLYQAHGEYHRTQDDAKAFLRAAGAPTSDFEAVEVPTDARGLVKFLNDLVAKLKILPPLPEPKVEMVTPGHGRFMGVDIITNPEVPEGVIEVHKGFVGASGTTGAAASIPKAQPWPGQPDVFQLTAVEEFIQQADAATLGRIMDNSAWRLSELRKSIGL